MKESLFEADFLQLYHEAQRTKVERQAKTMAQEINRVMMGPFTDDDDDDDYMHVQFKEYWGVSEQAVDRVCTELTEKGIVVELYRLTPGLKGPHSCPYVDSVEAMTKLHGEFMLGQMRIKRPSPPP